MAEIWLSWANQDAVESCGGHRLVTKAASSAFYKKREEKMTQFLKIDNRDYLVITPGYKSIDASVSHEFKEKLINIIDEGNNYIVIDLINVNYIDSIGLAGLISLLKTQKTPVILLYLI